MREIKFRFWNGHKMDYDGKDASIWNGHLVCEGDTIPMQFTGLHDSKGKEIYEADIVSTYDDGEYFHTTVVTLRSFGDCCVSGMGFRIDDHGVSINLEDLVVRGNVYETPGLIKEIEDGKRATS